MKNKKQLYFAVVMLIAFAVWTMLVKFFDVKSIGPKETTVGFAAINGFIHKLTGVNLTLYTITDWLGLVPILIAVAFAVVGIIQLTKRKNICKVDFDILTLGILYLITIAVYFFFEKNIINYRPILINGYLEASYPSSTTMLTMCVIPTAIIQFKQRIKNKFLKIGICLILTAFTIFMVLARFVSGVHWFTDIFGGILLSTGLVNLYNYFSKLTK